VKTKVLSLAVSMLLAIAVALAGIALVKLWGPMFFVTR
jgi:hypothetical protein